MALPPEEQQTLVDKILAIFTNEANAASFGQDPEGYIAENLPEGTEPGDIAACMPRVAEGVGGGYAGNLAGYNAAGTAATNSVVNEIAYTYNTIYQQNSFIYAEAGAQVTNIQGDGNAVAQQQIDADFHVGEDYGAGEDAPEDGYEPETPEGDGEAPAEEPGYEPEEPEEPDYEPEGGYEEPPPPPEEGYEPEAEAPAPDPEPDLPEA